MSALGAMVCFALVMGGGPGIVVCHASDGSVSLELPHADSDHHHDVPHYEVLEQHAPTSDDAHEHECDDRLVTLDFLQLPPLPAVFQGVATPIVLALLSPTTGSVTLAPKAVESPPLSYHQRSVILLI